MTRKDDIYVGGFQGYDQLDPADSLTGELGQDPLDAGYTLPDREPLASRVPSTVAEELRGESLEQHLSEEEPEVWDDDRADEGTDDDEEDPRAGRLVTSEDDGESPVPQGQRQMTARDAGRAGWAASAEEAAMHITRRTRG